MEEDQASTSILMSLSELAWIALLGFGVLYSRYHFKASEDRGQALGEIRRLERGYDDATREIADQREALAKLEEELHRKERKLQQYESQQEADGHKESLAEKQHKLDELDTKIDHDEQRLSELRKTVRRLEGELRSARGELKESRRFSHGTESQIADPNEQIANLQRQVDWLTEERDERIAAELAVRKELLNLEGSLKRVAFVLDCSDSMQRRGRWASTCRTVERWLTYLHQVEQCVLITFASTTTVYPDVPDRQAEDRTLDMTSDRNSKIQDLRAYLHRLEPGGRTCILEALQTAYEYDPDCIILFSDGGATKKDVLLPLVSETEMAAILRLAKEGIGRGKPRIHVVGVGDYFKRRQGQFLRELAEVTGGSFLGR